MTCVSPITRGSEAWFPVGGRGARPVPARTRPALRPGTLRVAGRRRPVGGAGALGAPVTTRGEMLIDW
jgi:hypothetical protein